MRLIDADKFKDKILSGLYIFCQENKEDIARAIDDEPTVDTGDTKYLEERDADAFESGYIIGLSERPQGHWIPNDKISPWGNPGRSCSLCGKIVEFSEKFCPKCGAKMITKE